MKQMAFPILCVVATLALLPGCTRQGPRGASAVEAFFPLKPNATTVQEVLKEQFVERQKDKRPFHPYDLAALGFEVDPKSIVWGESYISGPSETTDFSIRVFPVRASVEYEDFNFTGHKARRGSVSGDFLINKDRQWTIAGARWIFPDEPKH